MGGSKSAPHVGPKSQQKEREFIPHGTACREALWHAPDEHGGMGMVEPSAFHVAKNAIQEERVPAVPSTMPVNVPVVQQDQSTQPKEVRHLLSPNITGQLERVLPPPSPERSDVVQMDEG